MHTCFYFFKLNFQSIGLLPKKSCTMRMFSVFLLKPTYDYFIFNFAKHRLIVMSVKVVTVDDSQISGNIPITEISQAHNPGVFNFATLICRNPFVLHKKKHNPPKLNFSGPNMLRVKEQKLAAAKRKE
jgi:hypothetical protein